MLESLLLAAAAVAVAPTGLPDQPHDVGGAVRPMWVFFVPRPGEAGHALNGRVSDTRLTPRALARRARSRADGRLFDERDLPVEPAFIEAVERLGASVRIESRWLNAVSVVATPSQASTIAELPMVARMQPVAAGTRTVDALGPQVSSKSASAALDGGVAGGVDYGASACTLAQIDLTPLHERGFTGHGMVIGVLDTGFHRAHEAFNQPGHALSVVAEHDFINDDASTGIDAGDPPDQHTHGTQVLGLLASWLPGELVGSAPDAAYVLAKTEIAAGSDVQAEEDYFVAGLEFAEANGADVTTASLGYPSFYTAADLDGQTAITTIGVNIATANGMACVTVAGSEFNDCVARTSNLWPPGDAFDAITCGATTCCRKSAAKTNMGPTADGRVKPELVAPGQDATTVDPSATEGFSLFGGSSAAAPLVAGAVACLLEARPCLTIPTLREALIATARPSATCAVPDPLFVQGYGTIQADAASFVDVGDATCAGAEDATAPPNFDCCAGVDCDILGDITGDGVVNGADLGGILNAWAQPGGCTCPTDLNQDGVIDGADLGLVLQGWTL